LVDCSSCPVREEVKELRILLEDALMRGGAGQRERADFLRRYLNENGYICWSRLRDNEEAKKLFPHDTQLTRSVRYLSELNPHIKERKVDNVLFWHLDTFDFDAIATAKKWEKCRADDPNFHKYLVEQVILPAGKINLFDHLKIKYPDRSDDWRNDALDGVGLLCASYGADGNLVFRKAKYRVKRDRDWFEVMP
jgi:hypothetical protein